MATKNKIIYAPFFSGASACVHDKHGGWADKHTYYVIFPTHNNHMGIASYDEYDGIIYLGIGCNEDNTADIVAHETLHKILHGIINCVSCEKLDNIVELIEDRLGRWSANHENTK